MAKKGKKTLAEATDRELLAELARRHSQEQFREGMSFQEMEQSVERFKYGAGGLPLREMVERLKPETNRPKACPKCAQSVPVKAKERRRTVKTLSGPLELVRNYHHCESCQHGYYPRDALLGLPSEGELFPEFRQWMRENQRKQIGLRCAGSSPSLHWNIEGISGFSSLS